MKGVHWYAVVDEDRVMLLMEATNSCCLYEKKKQAADTAKLAKGNGIDCSVIQVNVVKV